MKLSGKCILVTGGAGFIGSHLVDLLAAENTVTVLDDFSTGAMTNLAAVDRQVRIITGDVRDPSVADAAVRDADVIFHLAVVCLREAIGDPMRAHLVNDLGTLNLLMSARQAPSVQRFVYISSSEVYGNGVRLPIDEHHPLLPMTPYAASKLAGEAYTLSFARTYGLRAMVVRPFNTYGPRAHLRGASGELIPKFVARAMAGRVLVIFGDGQQMRDFTWVEDTVQGIKLAAEADALVGDVVNIARGEGVSVLRIAELVQQVLGSSTPVQHVEPRPGDVVRQRADVRKARELIGFEAATPIEAGLRRYVDWVLHQPGDPASWLEGEEVVNWRQMAVTV